MGVASAGEAGRLCRQLGGCRQTCRHPFCHPHRRVLELGPDPDACAWLPGARLNIAECALSGRDPDRPALVWADEAAPTQLHTWTLSQLAARSGHVAKGLRAMGLRPGDAVALCLPMTADAVAAHLGVVLAGCVALGIADSFSAAEIASRLRITGARAVIMQVRQLLWGCY